jgi:Fic family protein
MKYLFTFMNEEAEIPPLVKIGLAHYFFETIHPYEDGNGRLGRTLILLYMIQLGIIEDPLLYISPFFEKNKEEYYSLLMKVRQEGDYLSWLHFFLDGTTTISIDTSNRVKELIDLNNDYRARLTESRSTPITFQLLDQFFENPYASIPMLQERLSANYPIVRRGIENLRQVNIVTEITKQKRNKFYLAHDVLDIIEKE